MVLLGIVVILIAIFVPYAADVRESSNRQRCQENLRKIGIALSNYASDNHGILPRVVYDEKNNPNGYTSFTGPDSGNPFGNDGKVSANDVTASLWLLVRQRYIPADYTPASSVFVCPSSWAKVDPLVDAAGNPVSLERRGNFRKAWNLSYSYCSPFSNAAGYGMISDFLSSTFVVMADKNPGIGKDSDVTGPAWDAPGNCWPKPIPGTTAGRGSPCSMATCTWSSSARRTAAWAGTTSIRPWPKARSSRASSPT